MTENYLPGKHLDRRGALEALTAVMYAEIPPWIPFEPVSSLYLYDKHHATRPKRGGIFNRISRTKEKKNMFSFPVLSTAHGTRSQTESEYRHASMLLSHPIVAPKLTTPVQHQSGF